MDDKQLDAMFSGVIGQEYQTLKLICPLAAKMSQLVGDQVEHYLTDFSEQTLSVLELGGGTGITTLAILMAGESVHITSVDNEAIMQNQAKQNLHKWFEQGRVCFDGRDALSVLQNTATASIDIVASAYTLHNFLNSYRAQVITEIYRVLKPGGQFINGDRYALDDVLAHTRLIQKEVSAYFKVLIGVNKLDVLEHWIVHLFADEAENHVMRETMALQQLALAGFKDINLSQRSDVNALVTSVR